MWKLEQGSWSSLPPLPYAVRNAASFVLNDRYMYVVGGNGDDGSWPANFYRSRDVEDHEAGGPDGSMTSDCPVGWTQMFDIESEEWTLKSEVPTEIKGRFNDGCLTNHGFVVVGINTFYCYESVTDTWAHLFSSLQISSLGGPVRVASYDGGMALIGDGGRVVLLGENGVATECLPRIPSLRDVEHAHIVSFPSNLIPLALAKQLLVKSAAAEEPETPDAYAQWGGAHMLMRNGHNSMAGFQDQACAQQ